MHTLTCMCVGHVDNKRLEDLIYQFKNWTNFSSTTVGNIYRIWKLNTYPVKEHKNNWNKIGIVILGLVFLHEDMKCQQIVLKLTRKE